MSDDLMRTTAFAFSCLLYWWLCFKGALFLRRDQRHQVGSRLLDHLGLTRVSGLKEWGKGILIAIYSGVGLQPFVPAVFAFLTWRENEVLIFNWVGWTSISIVGLLSFLRGLFLGKRYLEEYWKTVNLVKIEEIVPTTVEFPHIEFSGFKDCVLDLTFRGFKSDFASAAAKAGWRNWISDSRG